MFLNIAQSPIATGGNAYDALKNAPGIIAQGDQLNFRGKSITVLVNGRPSNLSGEDLTNMLNNLQASGIERIEILPNPSSKYEAAAGSSVVNIVLVKKQIVWHQLYTYHRHWKRQTCKSQHWAGF